MAGIWIWEIRDQDLVRGCLPAPHKIYPLAGRQFSQQTPILTHCWETYLCTTPVCTMRTMPTDFGKSPLNHRSLSVLKRFESFKRFKRFKSLERDAFPQNEESIQPFCGTFSTKGQFHPSFLWKPTIGSCRKPPLLGFEGTAGSRLPTNLPANFILVGIFLPAEKNFAILVGKPPLDTICRTPSSNQGCHVSLPCSPIPRSPSTIMRLSCSHSSCIEMGRPSLSQLW